MSKDNLSMGVRIAWMAALLLTACDDTRIDPTLVEQGSAERGRAAVERLGCGACHVIPGVWPRGTTGPPLDNLADRGILAGEIPNRPDRLADFLLDPSGTAMPKQSMTAREAADIAAFLYAR